MAVVVAIVITVNAMMVESFTRKSYDGVRKPRLSAYVLTDRRDILVPLIFILVCEPWLITVHPKIPIFV